MLTILISVLVIFLWREGLQVETKRGGMAEEIEIHWLKYVVEKKLDYLPAPWAASAIKQLLL
jgi:hypothetical protein